MRQSRIFPFPSNFLFKSRLVGSFITLSIPTYFTYVKALDIHAYTLADYFKKQVSPLRKNNHSMCDHSVDIVNTFEEIY